MAIDLTGDLNTIQSVATLVAAGLNMGTLAVEGIADAAHAIYTAIFGVTPTPEQSEAILASDVVQLATLAAREQAQATGGGTTTSGS
jgi:hypothetical protein